MAQIVLFRTHIVFPLKELCLNDGENSNNLPFLVHKRKWKCLFVLKAE